MFEILFQYGSVTLRTFNIILAFAFLFSGMFVIRYTHRQMMNVSFFSQNIIYILLSILVGGRLFYIFEHLPLFAVNPLSAFYVWDLHFSFFGGLYAIIVALFVLTRRSKENFWPWLDAGALATLVAMIFIHIAHFFNGTQYGTPTDLPWGIAFDTQNIPYLNAIHPTQLYAFVFTLLVVLYAFKKSKRVHLSGVVGSLALMLYSLGMMAIDFLHGDPSLYVKISFCSIAALAFISLVHCSSKTHSLPDSKSKL